MWHVSPADMDPGGVNLYQINTTVTMDPFRAISCVLKLYMHNSLLNGDEVLEIVWEPNKFAVVNSVGDIRQLDTPPVHTAHIKVLEYTHVHEM